MKYPLMAMIAAAPALHPAVEEVIPQLMIITDAAAVVLLREAIHPVATTTAIGPLSPAVVGETTTTPVIGTALHHVVLAVLQSMTATLLLVAVVVDTVMILMWLRLQGLEGAMTIRIRMGTTGHRERELHPGGMEGFMTKGRDIGRYSFSFSVHTLSFLWS